MCSIALYAQNDVTKFLGIPVDGTKEEMIQKLKAKGFRGTSYDRDILEGEFNGQKVNLFVGTNNNKVYRIMVADVNHVDEAQIKIRFNNLCKQFEKNPRYISLDGDQSISDDENILYGLNIYKKTYDAHYFQIADTTDSLALSRRMTLAMASKFSSDQIANLTQEEILDFSLEFFKEATLKKLVWFRVAEFSGKYYIAMFYDNKYNEANGEDL